MQLRIRKKLRPEDITILCDTREQTPADLSPMKMERGTLSTGDYTILGLEKFVACERKTLGDLVGCVGRERERFDKEIQRLRAYETRALFVDGTLSAIRLKQYRGTLEPNTIISSIMGWIQTGLPIVFCGDTDGMNDMMRRFLYITAQRYWTSSLPFVDTMLHADANLDTSP
jgi:DNA excision repair protein ERCC-4